MYMAFRQVLGRRSFTALKDQPQETNSSQFLPVCTERRLQPYLSS